MKSLRFALVFAILISTVVLAGYRSVAETQHKLVEDYGNLPLSFEANEGQTDARVRFLSRGSAYTLFLTGDEAVFSLRGSQPNRSPRASSKRRREPSVVASMIKAVLRMRLVKSKHSAEVTGVDGLPSRSNYFIGNDPKKWRSNVPTYAKVKYHEIYSGIDLIYYGNQRQLEYDFVAEPGSDPHRIQFDVRGARGIHRDKTGDLVLRTAVGDIRWRKPVVYQEKNGTRREIQAHYVIRHKNRVGFVIAEYDSRRPLYIDPLIYSTYLGGDGQDQALGIALDDSGEAYVTGYTNSANFPVTPGAFQTNLPGQFNAFVSKLDATGSALVYSTYLGGSEVDQGNGITVDSSGDVFVTGSTSSPNFPVTANAFQSACGGGDGGCYDAFVSKLNATGSALVYSTYLGGSENDQGNSIAVNSSGDAYVTGFTQSTNFPVTPGAFQTTFKGNPANAFVSELNPSGQALLYSTYLGGTGFNGDDGSGIAVDSSGAAYVTGLTWSTDFPITPGAFQTTFNSESNTGFVTKISTSGSALLYSTYLGGSTGGSNFAVAVDSSGNAYVTGDTASADFPVTPGAFQTTFGGEVDAYVSKLNPTGSALVYSTYLGGSGGDFGEGIAVDNSGNAYVTGSTTSTNFPTMDPFQPSHGSDNGNYDAFVAELNPSGSALLYSTYLGGDNADSGRGIAASTGNAYVTGGTASTDFPVTPGAFQTICNGGSGCSSYGDAFVAKIDTNASSFVTLVPPNLDFGNETVGIKSSPRVSTLTNSGELTLTITSIVSNSSEFVQTNNCPASIPQGGSCQIKVTFTPSETGTQNAAVGITDNAPGSPQSLPLTGIGVLPAVMFSPPTLTFGTQVVYSTSPPQKVTLTNTGQGILKITSAKVSGEFAIKTDCGETLSPGASCTANVTFKPTDKGPLSGSITISDNAPESPQSVPLSGTGTFVQLTPTSLNFGTQPVNTTSPPKTITLENKGNAPLNLTGTGISITGSDPGDFAQQNDCPSSLASGAYCRIKVTFTPLQQGKRTADVSVSDDGGGSPQLVPLTGTGTQ